MERGGAPPLWIAAERVTAGLSARDSDALPELQKKLERDPDLFLVAESAGTIVGAVIGAWDGQPGVCVMMSKSIEKGGSGIRVGGSPLRLVPKTLHRTLNMAYKAASRKQ